MNKISCKKCFRLLTMKSYDTVAMTRNRHINNGECPGEKTKPSKERKRKNDSGLTKYDEWIG